MNDSPILIWEAESLPPRASLKFCSNRPNQLRLLAPFVLRTYVRLIAGIGLN